MKLIAVLMFSALAWNTAYADEQTQCQANDGVYLTGTVTDGPNFTSGHPLQGVELSHTHLTFLADQDQQSYDVAIDNVFASGYDAAGEDVPAPLSSIQVGDRLELCGLPYTGSEVGIHWVHTDCGATPTPSQPNGWVKILNQDGTAGPNLESSEEYCRLWQ